MLFLIEYDRTPGKLVALRAFGDTERELANNARLQTELALKHRGLDHEVVILDAADEAALRRTHRRYFESLAELTKIPDNGA